MNPSTANSILTSHWYNTIFEETLTYFLRNHASLLNLHPSIPGILRLLRGEPWPFPYSCKKKMEYDNTSYDVVRRLQLLLHIILLTVTALEEFEEKTLA